jgi:hypothetical protein
MYISQASDVPFLSGARIGFFLRKGKARPST